MEAALQAAREQATGWVQAYGYHAVAPALLADPAGVPWAWVFLMLLAAKAGKSVPILLVYGIVVLCAADHALYWLGRAGQCTILPRLIQRFPKLEGAFAGAEKSVRENAPVAIVMGRYLPFVGRWVGVGAGLARVPYARFALWELGGAALTSVGFGLAAHFLGEAVLDAPWFPQALLATFILGTLSGLVWLLWSRRPRNAA